MKPGTPIRFTEPNCYYVDPETGERCNEPRYTRLKNSRDKPHKFCYKHFVEYMKRLEEARIVRRAEEALQQEAVVNEVERQLFGRLSVPQANGAWLVAQVYRFWKKYTYLTPPRQHYTPPVFLKIKTGKRGRPRTYQVVGLIPRDGGYDAVLLGLDEPVWCAPDQPLIVGVVADAPDW